MRATVLTCWIVITSLALVGGPARGQGVRERTRPKTDGSTAVNQSQANELTLTLTEVAVRPVQVWVRTAGGVDATRKTVTAFVSGADGKLINVGQRVRAFSPEARSSMYQARVSQVTPKSGGVMVTVTLSGQGRQDSSRYVLEIVTEPGSFLSVPNEAIIESGNTPVVYVEQQPGRYAPREIQLGLQGELYTQVLDGLKAGEQVVTFGSFFIDAEHKLRGS